MSKKVILIIMDGWGLGKTKTADAIQNAQVPFVTSLYSKYPNSTLVTCGEAVGLPDGQMGNSEVGHLNLGAGRIVYQELQRINVAIRDQSFFENEKLNAAIAYAKNNNKALHLIGLASDGGVHSHTSHLKAIVDAAEKAGLTQVYIHAFTDGRDCDPKSGLGFIQNLQQHIAPTHAKIASITGRYYAMDRDKRWERVKLAYDALVHGIGEQSNDLAAALQQSYDAGVTDEFIKPIINNNLNTADASIKDGDAVICFNFRTDRCREITQALTQQDFAAYNMYKKELYYTTLTEYDHSFKNIHIVFKNDNLKNTLGEVIAQQGLTQLRAAETEKYPHVTYFFNGGKKDAFDNEERILIPSPKDVAKYDEKPAMSLVELTKILIEQIQNNDHKFIVVNFANPDMVGHTGNLAATIQALELVDEAIGQIVDAMLNINGEMIITSDHGNCELMFDIQINQVHTQHTHNLVPFLYIGRNAIITETKAALQDIAPSILYLLNLEQPSDMTGKNIIRII